MRVFKNAWFGRFARKERISFDSLWDAVERADKGLIDVDLGGGVLKQRIARPGTGKSNGYPLSEDQIRKLIEIGQFEEVMKDG